jgi:CheY-like chemotaxis protein
MLKILLVDDEGVVIDVLKQILVRLGHHVETAPGGHEGMLKFDRQSYDLVITDVVMSDIDGRRVAQHIRDSKRPSTPIIGISGTPRFLEDEGFNSVIPKPFTINALAQAIDRALGDPTSLPRA